MRPQAAMIMGEWDRFNTVGQLPSTSELGAGWDNSRWVGPWLDEAADIIRNNQEHIELTLHGVNHEFWVDGVFTRGEWYSKAGELRPMNDITGRLSMYKRLLEENGLGGFPESYVPPSFAHIFSPEKSLMSLFKESGIQYMSTPFYCMLNADKVQCKYFGVEEGIINVDRGGDILSWFSFGTKPEKAIVGPICGMHWPNFLHEDPTRNGEIVDLWVEHLSPYDRALETLLAKNTKQMATQLVYHECTALMQCRDELKISFDKLNALGVEYLDDRFIMKIEADPASVFTGKGIEIIHQSYKQANGYHELCLRTQGGEGLLTW